MKSNWMMARSAAAKHTYIDCCLIHIFAVANIECSACSYILFLCSCTCRCNAKQDYALTAAEGQLLLPPLANHQCWPE
jgi:hypothetical protein